jgi:hypothetical protein
MPREAQKRQFMHISSRAGRPGGNRQCQTQRAGMARCRKLGVRSSFEYAVYEMSCCKMSTYKMTKDKMDLYKYPF